jgi:hypothetical protein
MRCLGQSESMARKSELLTCNPPLYLMNPSFRNLFIKELNQLRVVPTISASVSCEIRATIFFAVTAQVPDPETTCRAPLIERLAGLNSIRFPRIPSLARIVALNGGKSCFLTANTSATAHNHLEGVGRRSTISEGAGWWPKRPFFSPGVKLRIASFVRSASSG